MLEDVTDLELGQLALTPRCSTGLLLLCNAEFMGRFPGKTAAIGIYVASKVPGVSLCFTT